MKQLLLRKRRFLAIGSTVLFAIIISTCTFCRGQQPDVETDSAKIWVGKKAQSFTLPGIDGKPLNIASNLGKRPIVLVFYRGVW